MILFDTALQCLRCHLQKQGGVVPNKALRLGATSAHGDRQRRARGPSGIARGRARARVSSGKRVCAGDLFILFDIVS